MSEQSTQIEYHWVATIQNGPRLITCESTVNAVPGMHTRQSTTKVVFDHLTAQFGAGFNVIFFSLEPNAIPQAVARCADCDTYNAASVTACEVCGSTRRMSGGGQ